MNCILEFGVRGGAHTERLIITSATLATALATNLVRVFEDNSNYKIDFKINSKVPRKSWQSSSHFVSISVLDGIMRGPASAQLWKKDNVPV